MDRASSATAADRLRDAGDYLGARRAATADVRALQAARAPEGERAAALVLLGRIEEDLGNHAAASDAFEEARSLASGLVGTEAARALASAELAGVQRGLADPAGAHRLTVEAFRVLSSPEAPLPAEVETVVLAQAALDAIEEGDDASALAMADRALVAAGDMEPGARRARARIAALLAFGHAHQARGRYDAAAAAQRSALAEARESLGPGSVEEANALNDLGMTGKYEGRFEEAATAYARALELLDAAGGGTHPDSASVHHNLGGLAHARRDFAAGERPARRAVEIRSATLGPDHPVTLLDMSALGSILQGLGRDDEAEAVFRATLPKLEAALGADHHEVAVTVNNLAAILQRRGDLVEAEALYRLALATKERTLGPDSPLVATGLNNLATVLRRQGRLDEAEALYRRALSILEAGVEPDHPNLATTRRNLERLLAQRASRPPRDTPSSGDGES